MLCQNCQKRVANVHFTQKINNKKVEMYLCEQCANEKGQLNLSSPFSINDFFSGLIGFGSAAPYVASAPQGLTCDKCGMGYEEFQRAGKLGCSRCYELYEDRLKPLLKRLHGNVNHNGKIPNRLLNSIKASKEIERLKELLNQAVRNEEYEKAAEIRDRIKAIESGK